MDLVRPYKNERIVLKNISHNKNAWPQNKYKGDVFYQYALSNHSLPSGAMHEHYFSYTCYHRVSGEFVGYVQGYLPSTKKILWIQTFLIDRKFLGQGYGIEFYGEILTTLQQHNICFSKVCLACFDTNTIGKVFWEKLSFSIAFETTKFSKITHRLSKIVIYEKEIEELPQKELLYEQENFKNIGIQ